MKYVQNTHPGKAAVKLSYDDPSGALHLGKVKKISIDFRPEAYDNINGSVVNTGVTTVNDTVYGQLQKDPTFLYAVKAGWLTVLDSLPESVMTPTDALIAERQKVFDLTKQLDEANKTIEALKAQIPGTSGPPVSDLDK